MVSVSRVGWRHKVHRELSFAEANGTGEMVWNHGVTSLHPRERQGGDEHLCSVVGDLARAHAHMPMHAVATASHLLFMGAPACEIPGGGHG